MKLKYLLSALVVFGGMILTACASEKTMQTKKYMNISPTSVVLVQESIPIPQYRKTPQNKVMRLAWHPNGQEFAVIDDRLHILIFNAKTKHLIRQLPIVFLGASNEPVLAYSPDGRYLAAGKDIINVFDAATGEEIHKFIPPDQNLQDRRTVSITGMVFSPDSKSLAVSYNLYWFKGEKGPKEAIAIFDAATGVQHSVIKAPIFHSGSHFSTNMVYTPDGKYILAGRWSLLPYAEQVKTGEPFRYFTFIDYIDSQTGQFSQSITPVHIMRPTALAISSDGCYVASGTNTGTSQSPRRPNSDKSDYIDNQDPVRLWDIKTRKLVREYPIQDSVEALAISPDERYLAVHNNLKIVLFDFATGEFLQTIKLPGTLGFSLSLELEFSSDGKKLAIPLDSQVYLLTLK